MRSDHDPLCTYEGDNNVLGQQASNWLLRQWSAKELESPIGSVKFLERRKQLLQLQYTLLVQQHPLESWECECGCRSSLEINNSHLSLSVSIPLQLP